MADTTKITSPCMKFEAVVKSPLHPEDEESPLLHPAAVMPQSCCCGPAGYVARHVLDMDYSVVSGVLPQRVAVVQARLNAQKAAAAGGAVEDSQTTSPLPFESLICCNIGCPQSMGQPFIRYPRMVLSLLEAPFLLDHPSVGELYPMDVIAKARKYLAVMGGPSRTGAYTPPHGFPFVRTIVAEYITKRDRHIASALQKLPSSTEGGAELAAQVSDDVMMTDGASVGVRQVMQLVGGRCSSVSSVTDGPLLTASIATAGVRTTTTCAAAAGGVIEDAILLPVPAYPLYTALLPLLGVKGVKYFLDESVTGWQLTPACIEKALREQRAWIPEGETTVPTVPLCRPRCLIVPNPGNPTGQVLTRSEMEAILRLCHRHGMLLLADEVYQENIYEPERCPFLSFRAVCLMCEDESIRTETSIVSLHSVSKGLLAECGRRGGYMALTNCTPTVRQELMKLNSVNICPNINGQLLMALMLDPPQPGDASYDQFQQEMHANFSTLQHKATSVAAAINAVPGIECTAPPGAMYVFPTVTLPQRYLDHVAMLNKQENVCYTADTRWCLELLDRFGVVVIPGDGFLQAPGTFHFRTTILPSEAQFERMVSAMRALQEDILSRFA